MKFTFGIGGLTAALCTTAALLSGPAGCDRTPGLGPPVLHLNQDTCHECGMTVSDERHAAAIVVLRDGARESYVFDDTGEMLEFIPPRNCSQVKRYAHDFVSGQWQDARDLHFVRDRSVHTPMDSGVVAYADAAKADEAARKPGAAAVAVPSDSTSGSAEGSPADSANS